ncbi:gliding motility-associated C-terminal domain-containing protein [Hymenobacter psychrotolerans DSM 18569]|uniref:Gliding motility-associated C-terminal domain-containing protein n=1 Tax=Hymenobacter psychrotolerans DSM 18569 TaxID=1121959 RepID=A0A1M7E1N7_9BACT|nr:gliding motility-associated C-terminal domain-containing protein [Hymenobacter psychrotolerans DSM 18569]
MVNPGGLIKASSDGRRLACSFFCFLVDARGNFNGVRLPYQEVAEFDNRSGRIASAYIIPDTARYKLAPSRWSGGTGGLEFSPDGSRLYVDTLAGREIWQYNLNAGSPAAVAASRVVVARPVAGAKQSGAGNNLQLGPDGRIYHASTLVNRVGRFESPNALGSATRYRDTALVLTAGATTWAGLPRATNDLNLLPVVVAGPGSISVQPACAGTAVQLSSSLSPFVTATAYAWNFGDPASGPLNTASGQAPAHQYQTAGTYTVTLIVTAAGGGQYSTTQTVQVRPRPVVDMGPDVRLCAGETQVLSPGPQPAGSTFRWQNGSTAAELTAATAGIYSVTVTSPSGCAATDELIVTQANCAGSPNVPDFTNLPNIITPNQDAQNEYFVLKGLKASDWNIEIYNRWGRQVYRKAGYDNSWNATGQPEGVYYYLLRHAATGQQHKGWMEVSR